jgi:hypothetical protein
VRCLTPLQVGSVCAYMRHLVTSGNYPVVVMPEYGDQCVRFLHDPDTAHVLREMVVMQGIAQHIDDTGLLDDLDAWAPIRAD